MRLAQRLGQLEQQLVHRDRPREAGAEGLQRLVGRVPLAVDEPVGLLVQPLAGRQVQQRRDPGRDHRQHEEAALVLGRANGRGRPRPPGRRATTTPVRPVNDTVVTSSRSTRPSSGVVDASIASGIVIEAAAAIRAKWSGQPSSRRSAVTTRATSPATTTAQPIHCSRCLVTPVVSR